MDLGEAPKEKVTFDQSKITSTGWTRCKTLTMAETPHVHTGVGTRHIFMDWLLHISALLAVDAATMIGPSFLFRDRQPPLRAL